MPIIQEMVVQSGGSKPHVKYMMVALAMNFPTIIWKLGGKVDRLTRGGHVSAHASGRAIDIYLEASNQPDKQLGDLLFKMYVDNAADLKVEHVIWNSQEWSPGGGGTYGTIPADDPRGPHTDHVHVAFEDVGLDKVPSGKLAKPFDRIKTALKRLGYQDWLDGKYGKAFDPKNPFRRLSQRQRYERYYRDAGIVPMALPPSRR